MKLRKRKVLLHFCGKAELAGNPHDVSDIGPGSGLVLSLCISSCSSTSFPSSSERPGELMRRRNIGALAGTGQ